MRAWLKFLPLLLIIACDLIDPEEPLPSYIYVTPFESQATNNQQGTTNHKITEAWLTVDGEFLGVYNLPAHIPILKEGVVDIFLEAGIKDNGISTLPEIYPFFNPFQATATLQPLATDTIRPIATYRNNIAFALIEDFESSEHVLTDEIDGDENTRVVLSTEDVFEGNQSGKIELTTSHSRISVASRFNERFRGIQEKGVQVYIELNYKTDIELGIGLIGHYDNINQPSEALYEPILFPKETWNKVYLNLSEAAFVLGADEYQIAFIAALPNELDRGSIWLDNIKLIHF